MENLTAICCLNMIAIKYFAQGPEKLCQLKADTLGEILWAGAFFLSTTETSKPIEFRSKSGIAEYS